SPAPVGCQQPAQPWRTRVCQPRGGANSGYNCSMSTPILATKLYIPPPRPKLVLRPRLFERLNEGLHRKLTLISAPAGFGKTTLVSEWVASLEARDLRREASKAGPVLQNDLNRMVVQASRLKPQAPKVAWLSLDDADRDPTRFLSYLVAALQMLAPTIGAGVVETLQSPQPPPTEAIVTALLNDII